MSKPRGQQSTNLADWKNCLLIGAGLLLGLLLAWGAEKEVLLHTWEAIRQPLTVGGLELSLIGFVYAFLILLITSSVCALGATSSSND